MARIILQNKNFISLDSLESKINVLNETISDQSSKMNDLLNQNKKMTNQLRIHNMYSAHENDFVIDDNIFENDEI